MCIFCTLLTNKNIQCKRIIFLTIDPIKIAIGCSKISPATICVATQLDEIKFNN